MTVQTICYDDAKNHDNSENHCIHLNQALTQTKLADAGLMPLNGLILLPCFFHSLQINNESIDITEQLLLSQLKVSEKNIINFIGDAKSLTVKLELCIGDASDTIPNELSLYKDILFTFNNLEDIAKALHDIMSAYFNQSNRQAKHVFSASLHCLDYGHCLASGIAYSRDLDSGFEAVTTLFAETGFTLHSDTPAFSSDEFHVSQQALSLKKNAIIQRKLGHKTVYLHLDDNAQVSSTDLTNNEQRQFSITDQQVEAIATLTTACKNTLHENIKLYWHINAADGQIHINNTHLLPPSRQSNTLLERYLIKEKGLVLVEGRSIGQRIASGPIRIITHRKDIGLLQKGEILVTDMTDPDWESVIDKAAAIITNRGGRTCHAAIIARELGVPAIVGCINATEVLRNETDVTVSCAEGDTGYIYRGLIHYAVSDQELFNTPKLNVSVMMNVGNPDRAYQFQSYPNNGIGLARLEFIINRMIGIHPKALLNSHKLSAETQAAINIRIAGFDNPIDFFKAKIMEGVSTIAAAFSPKKVVVRLSDFKSNEYSHLIGGTYYEPTEENPMLGFRGVSRYLSDDFMPCFKLECQALKATRDEMGFTNIEIMVPFCRTLGEAKQVIELMAENGLVRGENGLKIIMMCEIPANAILAEQFLEYFDGFSIGSNDLTQLTLGLDRDSALVAHLFDERNDAVKALFKLAIDACKKAGKSVSVCGQAPSEHPDLALWFVEQGVDSLSLNPDAVLETLMHLNKHQDNCANK